MDFDVFLVTKEKNLQRGLVWNIDQKRAFILTLLKGQRINPIIVVQNNDDNKKYQFKEKYQWQVIDGKQRLTTVFAFLNDEFTIDHKGEFYHFKDMPTDCQKQIGSFDFQWDVHYSYSSDPITDQTKIDLFEEINFLGTPQDIQHLNDLKS